MMRINLNQALKNRKLEPLKDESGEVLTLGLVAMMALDVPEKNMTGKEKFKRGRLINNMQKAMYADDAPGCLDVGEVELEWVTEAVGKMFSPNVVFQVREMLEVEEEN